MIAARRFVCFWPVLMLVLLSMPLSSLTASEPQSAAKPAEAGSSDSSPSATVTPKQISAAWRSGMKLVSKAAANYPQHRQCFSCHHQTLPLFVLDEARKAGHDIDTTLFAEQTRFSVAHFEKLQENMLAGEGVGGKTLTVSYGLWTFDIARRPPDELSAAMVAYLLKNQSEDGSFPRHSFRPPMSESLVTTTVLSANFLRKYRSEQQIPDVDKAVDKAVQWLQTAPLSVTEDFAFKVWGNTLLNPSGNPLASSQSALLKLQQPDGGWGQAADRTSDAYATGQAVYVLLESQFDSHDPHIERAITFLEQTQHDDGSWLVETRAKPVQIFFDNGDPHGKSQFLSIAATSWATAALIRYEVTSKSLSRPESTP